MLDINELRNELPKIGDVLIKIPVTSAPSDKPKIQPKAYACVVRYVHPKNLWYQVEFNIKGNKFKQSDNLIDDDYNKENRTTSHSIKFAGGEVVASKFYKNKCLAICDNILTMANANCDLNKFDDQED